MSDVRWYRSLYWRIAFGFIGFLAVLLITQALLFLVLARQSGGLFPATSNERLAEIVASDIREELERNPSLDVASHVSSQYGRVVQPFVVVLVDGAAIVSREPLPPPLIRTSRLFLRRMAGEPPPDGGAGAGPGFGPRRGGRPGPGPRRQSDPERLGFFSPIVVNGELRGVVAVPQGPPPLTGTLRALGPTLAISGLVLLVVGAAGAAALIGGPVRRRLELLGDAATRIGAGDTAVRAPVNGADEVTALASAFNRMASDLQARANALSASDEARRQLLADVSHELMTPLTAMRGYIETLSMPELNLDAATREKYLGIIDEETRRLERIIGDLLDLARIEGGGASLRHEPVAVKALFDRVEARHGHAMATRGISLATRIDALAEEVVGDADRLEQVLQNLAANALRHTPDGGRISLTASRAGDRVTLVVHDSGPGIPPEHLPHIFDRFYKADASRASAGSGLGLSIVRSIVEALGGSITVRNDNGARFEITLLSAQS